MKKIVTFTDGGARGNPGPAAIGVVIQDVRGETIEAFGKYIGATTNNVAEYSALLAALEHARRIGATHVTCFLDSELVVKQMKREYRVKNEGLAKLFVKIWNLAQGFEHVEFKHVRRERNKEADALVNAALDAR